MEALRGDKVMRIESSRMGLVLLRKRSQGAPLPLVPCKDTVRRQPFMKKKVGPPNFQHLNLGFLNHQKSEKFLLSRQTG